MSFSVPSAVAAITPFDAYLAGATVVGASGALGPVGEVAALAAPAIGGSGFNLTDTVWGFIIVVLALILIAIGLVNFL